MSSSCQSFGVFSLITSFFGFFAFFAVYSSLCVLCVCVVKNAHITEHLRTDVPQLIKINDMKHYPMAETNHFQSNQYGRWGFEKALPLQSLLRHQCFPCRYT